MTLGSNNNHGRGRDLNLNEMYNGSVSSQPLVQSSQQTSGLINLKIFLTTWIVK